MKSDFCKENFDDKVRLFLSSLRPYVEECLKISGLENMKIMLVPLPTDVCQECAINMTTDILKAVLSGKSYLLLTGDYQYIDSFLETLRTNLISYEEYEGVPPLDKIRRELNECKPHYIGEIKFEK